MARKRPVETPELRAFRERLKSYHREVIERERSFKREERENARVVERELKTVLKSLRGKPLPRKGSTANQITRLRRKLAKVGVKVTRERKRKVVVTRPSRPTFQRTDLQRYYAVISNAMARAWARRHPEAVREAVPILEAQKNRWIANDHKPTMSLAAWQAQFDGPEFIDMPQGGMYYHVDV